MPVSVLTRLIFLKCFISAGKDKEGRPVSSSHDTFVLIASSQQEMEEWIRAINRIIYAVR